jgi:hypothetical protein
MGNMVLAAATVIGVWAWHRRDFRQPRFLERAGLPLRPLTVLAGWLIIGATVLMLLGDVLGGYTARNLDPGQHVHRSHDALAFWLQLVLQLVVYAGTGMYVIAVSRSGARGYLRPALEGPREESSSTASGL